MNTIIHGGTVVTASDAFLADIGIEAGVISHIGRDLAGSLLAGSSGAQVIDASGMYVLPGAIDAHVHCDLEFGGTVTCDGFYLRRGLHMPLQ